MTLQNGDNRRARGPQGQIGPDGRSAYLCALDHMTPPYPTEAEWVASLRGPAGDVGPKGDKGDSGDQGIQGIQGIQGVAGPSLGTLLGSVVISQTAAIAISAGVRQVTVALAGTSVGDKLLCFPSTHTLNGGSVTQGMPVGYQSTDCTCTTAGNVTVSINAPLLAIGATYAITFRIYRVT